MNQIAASLEQLYSSFDEKFSLSLGTICYKFEPKFAE
jgi:hypothetical protein